MEELGQQVKMELLRTLIWVLLSLGVGMAVFYFVL
jgi:hypothetical protein